MEVSSRRLQTEADAKMFPAKIDAWIGELMSLGRGDRTAGDCSEGRPYSVHEHGLITNDGIGMSRHRRRVFGNVGRPIVIPVVSVGNACAGDIVQFDLESMRLRPRVIDRIEIIDAAIGRIGPDGYGITPKTGRNENCGTEGAKLRLGDYHSTEICKTVGVHSRVTYSSCSASTVRSGEL